MGEAGIPDTSKQAKAIVPVSASLKVMLEQRDLDEQLLSLLWDHVPGDDRLEVAKVIEAPGSRYPNGANRLTFVVDPSRRINPNR